MLAISYNKDLLLTLILLETVIVGVLQLFLGFVRNGEEKPKTYGMFDVLAGIINLGIVVVVLIF